MAVINELGKYSPHEVIYAEELPQLRGVVGFLKDRLCCAAQAGDRAAYSPENAARLVSKQFGEDTVNRLAESPLAVQALGGLLAYLKVTQFTGLERLLEVTTYLPQEFMRLDVAARRNLELTETGNTFLRPGSDQDLDGTAAAALLHRAAAVIGECRQPAAARRDRADQKQYSHQRAGGGAGRCV